MRQLVHRYQWACLASASVLLAACGGGSDGDAPPTSSGSAPTGVTITGVVTYDFVPVAGGGLDYPQTEARPARLVTVQFIAGGSVEAVTRTDQEGNYRLEVDADTAGFVRVLAESRELGGAPSWHFRVVDNTSGDAVYTLDGAVASSGTEDSRRDLHAASGWTGAAYGNERAAAPFAILDTILVGAEYVAAAEPALALPPLDIHWSPDNVPAAGADGRPDPDSGEIVTSQYARSPGLGMEGIYLVGAENNDTEEYDRHVILHEFGHYLEFELGRTDSFGGPHSITDRLDFRVAFSEGWGSAFAGLALGDPVYRDTSNSRQSSTFGFNIEGGFSSSAGWFQERSMFQLIYDLVDTDADLTMNDTLAYPFADVWSVMTGAIVTTPALTSIFPFLNAIKSAHSADQMQIDALASRLGIGSISTDFGDNETNDAGSGDVLPIYSPISVNGPAVNLCSTNEFEGGSTGATNKLGSRRYARFTPPAAGSVTITAIATSVPAGRYADPDFFVHRQGASVASTGAPSDACMNVASPAWNVSSCQETSSVSLTSAVHVLDVHEWSHVDPAPDADPIGRTCFDVMVTQP